MQVVVKGKNVEITPALRSHAEKKAVRVARIFAARAAEAQVTLRIEHGLHIADVTVLVDGLFLRGEERTTDMYASIEGAFDKVERQVRKHKTRINDRLRHTGNPVTADDYEGEGEVPEEVAGDLVRVKRFAVKPMGVEEAVMQMELLAHDFFVFRDTDRGGVSVVYRRKGGGYGLLSPEA